MSLAKPRELKPVTVFLDVSVINAEVLFIELLLEHSVAFAASEHGGPPFRRMFPDSDIVCVMLTKH